MIMSGPHFLPGVKPDYATEITGISHWVCLKGNSLMYPQQFAPVPPSPWGHCSSSCSRQKPRQATPSPLSLNVHTQFPTNPVNPVPRTMPAHPLGSFSAQPLTSRGDGRNAFQVSLPWLLSPNPTHGSLSPQFLMAFKSPHLMGPAHLPTLIFTISLVCTPAPGTFLWFLENTKLSFSSRLCPLPATRTQSPSRAGVLMKHHTPGIYSTSYCLL